MTSSKKNPSLEIFIRANHPVEEPYSSLLELKEKELQGLIKAKGMDVSLKGNPNMRKAIWGSISNLELKEVDISITKAKEDRKRLWEQIDSYLPFYALFQSDRNSRDGDDEVQDPMRIAIGTALSEVQEEIVKIQQKVREKAIEIANNTHQALMKLDANMAKSLEPQFTPPLRRIGIVYSKSGWIRMMVFR